MRPHLRRFLLGVLLALASLAATAAAEADQRKTVALVFQNIPNPPRYLGSGTTIDWTKPGLTLEMLLLVAKDLGIKFEFKRVPWKRGLFMLKSGEADGVFHASFMTKRTEFGRYPMRDGAPDPSRSIFDQSYVLYTVRGAPVRWDGTDLTGLKAPVGTMLGYSIVGDLERMGVPVEEGKTQEINIKKLVNGRIAAFAELQGTGDAFIRNYFKDPDIIEKLEPPLITKPYYLLLSKAFYAREPELAERIWDGIRDVKTTAAYRALEERYFTGQD